MKITIGSSSKFYDDAKALAARLQGEGITVFTPRFDWSEEEVAVGFEQKQALTLEFLDKIRQSNVLYVVANGGYTGTSVCIEVGYAHALGKRIYISDPPQEHAISALVTGVIPLHTVSKDMLKE